MLVENPREKNKSKKNHPSIKTSNKLDKQLKKRDPFIGIMLACFIGAIGQKIIKEIGIASDWYLVVLIFMGLGLFWRWKFFTRHNQKVEESEPIKKQEQPQSAVEISADFLTALIIAGERKNSLTGKIFYELNDSYLPVVGNKNVISDGMNEPMVEIQTTEVLVRKFREVPDEFIQVTPLKNNEYWRKYHEAFLNHSLADIYTTPQDSFNELFGSHSDIVMHQSDFSRLFPTNSEKLGIRFKKITENFLVVCERFEVTKIYPKTYEQWLTFATELLQETCKNDPHLEAKTDANILLQFVTKKDKATIYAFSETILTEAELIQLFQLLCRRYQGEPMAYILGETEFWSLNLKVSEDTLIPRPDTETLVEQAIELAKQQKKRPHFDGTLNILDLGTGTGAIALALTAELQNWCDKNTIKLNVVGVDRIAEAVALAKRNAVRNNLPQVEFLHSDWFSALEGWKFDIIVSNPPYIDKHDEHLAQGDVRFEPLSALVAEEQGYADLRFLIENAPHFLNPPGWLLLEHGWQQGEKVRSIFAENLWRDIATVRDYGDNERVTLACWDK